MPRKYAIEHRLARSPSWASPLPGRHYWVVLKSPALDGAASMPYPSGCPTTELALRLGISAASASEHSRALRKAGLVSSSRANTASALGLQLFESAQNVLAKGHETVGARTCRVTG